MTEELLPAWSEPFVRPDLVENLLREVRIDCLDREWAWGGATGSGVTVAIIDSGLEVGHPALQGRVIESVAVELVDGEPNVVPDDAGDLFGHGTACGGIIVGLAPDVDLVSVRVLGADLRGKGTAFLAGLEWAVKRGVQVANLSLSSKSEALYPAFHEVVDEANFARVALVSAANNVPGAELPVAVLIGLLGRGPRGPRSVAHLLQPAAAGRVRRVGRRRAHRLEGRRHDRRDRQQLRRSASRRAWWPLIASKHPGLMPFEIKAALASVSDDPRDVAHTTGTAATGS